LTFKAPAIRQHHVVNPCIAMKIHSVYMMKIDELSTNCTSAVTRFDERFAVYTYRALHARHSGNVYDKNSVWCDIHIRIALFNPGFLNTVLQEFLALRLRWLASIAVCSPGHIPMWLAICHSHPLARAHCSQLAV